VPPKSNHQTDCKFGCRVSEKIGHYRDVDSTLRAGFDVEVIEAFQRTCHKLKIGSVREYRRVDHVRHERHHRLGVAQFCEQFLAGPCIISIVAN